jgi:competence protein ComGC
MILIVPILTVLIIAVIPILRRRATDAGNHGDNEQEKSD